MVARKTPAARIAFVAAFLVLALALIPVALAKGKPGGGSGGGGSTSGSAYSVTVSPAGTYTFGESVSTTTTAPQVSGSYIGLACYQSGVLVLSGSHANWSSGWYFNWPWVLGPTQSWTGGAANCTVTVFHLSNNRTVTDASTSFTVSG